MKEMLIWMEYYKEEKTLQSTEMVLKIALNLSNLVVKGLSRFLTCIRELSCFFIIKCDYFVLQAKGNGSTERNKIQSRF